MSRPRFARTTLAALLAGALLACSAATPAPASAAVDGDAGSTIVVSLPDPQADEPARQPPFGEQPIPPLRPVRDLGRPPAGFRLSAAEAIAAADADPTIRAERGESPAMRPRPLTRGVGRWQIEYFQDGEEVAIAVVDDASGAVIEAWRDHQVEVKLARGYEGAVAGNVNEAWVWIPLCLLFVAPFFDFRRPFRLLHLDLFVLLSFSVSLFFFNKGEITLSVPLVYPALAYLFGRLLWAGLRPARRSGRLIPHLSVRWLAVAAIVLAAVRIGFNLADSQVIDIGFANVVGADRIASGEGVYDGHFTPLIDRGDSYGPASYLSYVPFEQLWPWHGGLESLPAAHAAAIAFDLAVALLLLFAGRRLRGPEDRREGHALGVALSFAWLACPFTLYALNANGGNDALVAALLVATLIAVSRPLWRGVLLGLAAAVKFGPLALAPLFAAGEGRRRIRPAIVFAVGFAVVWAIVLIPLLPGFSLDGLREFYDRTFGYQASRGSPFSVWGLAPSLGWLQDLSRVAAVLLGLLAFLIPRRRTPLQIAALGAALLIAIQAGSMHWFYFFISWWLPYALIALFGAQERIAGAGVPAGAPVPAAPSGDRRAQLAELR